MMQTGCKSLWLLMVLHNYTTYCFVSIQSLPAQFLESFTIFCLFQKNDMTFMHFLYFYKIVLTTKLLFLKATFSSIFNSAESLSPLCSFALLGAAEVFPHSLKQESIVLGTLRRSRESC